MRKICFLLIMLIFSGLITAADGGTEIIIPAVALSATDSMGGSWGNCVYDEHLMCAAPNPIGAGHTSDWRIAQERNCSGLFGKYMQYAVVLQFNTADIPDSVVVDQVILGVNVESLYTTMSLSGVEIVGRDMLDTDGGPASALTDYAVYYDAVISGNPYLNFVLSSTGYCEIPLNEQAEGDLDSLLDENWFAVGIYVNMMQGGEAMGDYDTSIAYMDEPVTAYYLKVIYNPTVLCTVQTSFPDGEVIVDSTNYPSPYVTYWENEEHHTIEVDSVQTPAAGIRYEYRSWSDTGTRHHEIICPETEITYTADFEEFYRVWLISPFGTLTGDGWHTPGAGVNISVVPETVYLADSTIRHIFLGWVGDGSGSYTGSNNMATITVNEPITETASWDTSYYLTVIHSGIPDTTPYLTGEGWHDPNIWVDIFAQDSLRRDGIWYYFDHWTGGVFGDSMQNDDSVYLDYPITITAIYIPDPEIIVFPPESTVINRGDIVLIPAIFDALFEVDIDSFQFDMVYDTTRFDFVDIQNAYIPWPEVISERIADTVRVFIDEPAPIGIEPPETLFYYRFNVNTDAGYGWFMLDMMNFMYDFADVETQPGTVFVLPETVSVVVTNDFGSGTVYVDETPFDAPYGDDWLGGSSHIIDADSIVNPETGIELRFTGWNDGITDRQRTVSAISDTTFTAQFDTFYYLEVITDYGTPFGEGSFLAHTLQQFSVIPEEVVEPSGLTRHIFEGWEGEYTGPDNPAEIWMSSPVTETAQWRTEHYRTLEFTGCGAATPTLIGENWHTEDTWQLIIADSFVVDGSDTFFFVQWLGGDVESPFQCSTQAFVAGVDTITALYGDTPFFIKVFPPETSVVPFESFDLPILFDTPFQASVNIIYIEVGFDPLAMEAIMASLGSVPFDSLKYNLMPNKIIVRAFGDVDILPTDTIFFVRLNPLSAIITQTEVFTANPGDDIAIAEIDTGDVFIHQPVTVYILSTYDGAVIDIDTEPTTLPTEYYTHTWDTIALDSDSLQNPIDGMQLIFDSWSDIADRARTLVPHGDTTITAYFDIEYYVDVVSDWSSTAGSDWYTAGTGVGFSVLSDSVHDGDSYHLFTGWEGDGSGSYTGTDNPGLCYVFAPIIEEAQWDTYHNLTLDYTGCGGAVPILTGEGYYLEGTNAVITTEETVIDGPTTYYFRYWDCPVADRLSANTTALIDEPYEIVAVYGDEAVSFMLNLPDTVYGAPGEFLIIPVIFYGTLAATTGSITFNFDFDLLGVIDAFTIFDDVTIEDHSDDDYVILDGASTAPISLESGDTVFQIICVARDYTGTCAISLDNPGGDFATGVGNSGVFVCGNIIHIELYTSEGCTLFVNGAFYADSFVANIPAGTPLSFAAPEYQYIDTGVRKRFVNWSDAGARIRSFVPIDDFSASAIYAYEFEFTQVNPFGESIEGQWADSNDVIFFEALPLVIESDIARCDFAGWDGIGLGSYSGSDNPASCVMLGAITESAVWDSSFMLELDSDCSGAILIGEGFYLTGEWVEISTSAQVEGLRFTHWSGAVFADSNNSQTQVLVEGYTTATAHYTADYAALIDAELPTSEADCFPVLYHGAAIDVDTVEFIIEFVDSFILLDGINECGDFTASFDSSHSGDISIIEIDLTSASVVSLDDGDTLVCICFQDIADGVTKVYSSNFANDLAGIAGGMGSIVSGALRNVTITGPAGSDVRWDEYESVSPLDTLAVQDSWHEISAPDSFVDGAIKLNFSGWQDGISLRERTVQILSDTQFTAIYDSSFYIRVTSIHGIVTGDGWYPKTADAFIVVSPETIATGTERNIFTGWSGTIVTTDNPLEFEVYRSETLTAGWGEEYRLAIHSEFGNDIGDGWYDSWVMAWAGIAPDTIRLGETTKVYFNGWTGDTTHTANPIGIVMTSPRDVTANWAKRHRIVATSDSGTVTGNGWYEDGAIADIEVSPTSIVTAPGERLNFECWYGLISPETSADFSFDVYKPESLWAYWLTQYWVDVHDGGHGAVTESDWFDEGDIAIVEADPDTEYIADGIRWKFANWTGTGAGSYSGPDNPATVHVFSTVGEHAEWGKQFMLNIDVVGADFATPTIEGEGYQEAYSTVDISADRFAYIGEIRYHFTHWSGGAFGDSLLNETTVILDTTKTITANYGAYEISPINEMTGVVGETLRVPIMLYNDALVQVNTAQLVMFYPHAILDYIRVEESPTGVDWGSLAANEMGDSVVVFGSVPPPPNMVTPPETLFIALFRVIGSGIGEMFCDHFQYNFAGASGSHSGVYVGDPISVRIETDVAGDSWIVLDDILYDSPLDTSLYAGQPHTISTVPEIAGAPGEVLVFNNWSDTGEFRHSIVITEPDTFTAHFGMKYWLDVESYYAETWGDGWYNSGEDAGFGISPTLIQSGSSRHRFTGWLGTGSGSYTGSNSSDIAFMSEPTTETAQWQAEHLVSISSAYGAAAGGGWFLEGADATARCVPDTIYISDDSRRIFEQWVGTLSSSDNPFDFAVNQPTNLSALWHNEHQVIVHSAHGTPSGNGWYSDDALAEISVAPILVDSAGVTRFEFTGWTGTVDTSVAQFNYDVDAPAEFTALWERKVLVEALSDWGYVSGTGFYSENDSAELIFAPETTEVDGWRYVFSGWLVDDDTVSGNPLRFVVREPITASVLFDTLVVLDVVTAYGVQHGAGYYHVGDEVVFGVEPAVINEGTTRRVFSGWRGLGTDSYSGGGNPAIIIIIEPTTEIAIWGTDYYVELISDHGSPQGEGWYAENSTATISVESPIDDGLSRYEFSGWTGDETSSDNPQQLEIDMPKSIIAEWDTFFWVELYAPGLTTEPELIGEGFYENGEIADISAPTVADDEGARNHFDGWSGLYTGDDNPLNYTVIQAGSLAANYSDFEVSPQDTITGAPSTIVSVPVIIYNSIALDVDSIGFDLFVPVALTYQDYIESSINWDEVTVTDFGTRVRVFAKSSALPAILPPDTVLFLRFNIDASPTTGEIRCDTLKFDITLAGTVPGIFIPIVGYSIELSTSCGCSLDVDATAEASPYLTTWNGGEVHQIAVPETVSGDAGERFVFDVWSDGFEDNERELLVESDTTIQAHYVREIAFGVFNPYGFGLTDPLVGTYWLLPPEIFPAMAESPDEENRMFCSGYIGVGSIPDGVDDDCEFNPTESGAIFWQWDNMVPLVITSLYGTPIPAGSLWCKPGDNIEAIVDSIVPVSLTSRHICIGWDATGALAPTSGDGATANVTINDESALTWNWLDQYWLELAAAGIDDGTPTFSGEGWHFEDSSADVSTDAEFISGDGDHFFFDNWETYPGGGALTDPESEATELVMNMSYTAIAYYDRGVKLVAKKVPSHSEGWMSIAGGAYTGVESLTVWRPAGETVQIAISTIDTVPPGTAYLFDGWNFDLSDTVDILLNDDFTATALYTLAYRTVICKLPAETYGSLTIDEDVFTGASSVLYEDWWREGSEHNVTASTPDSIDGDERYGFYEWHDGEESNARTLTATAAESLAALYRMQYLLTVDKNPAESYGWISIDGEIAENSASASAWVWQDSTVEVSVSGNDIAGLCSLYTFLDWTDGPTDSSRNVTVDDVVNLEANYSGDTVKIDIELSNGTWNIPGELDRAETYTMLFSELIEITNNSTLPVQFGLELADCDGLAPAYFIGHDVFTLRAAFNDEITAPTFSPNRDFVKSTLLWATSLIFGPGGENVVQIPGSNTENLWMQFIAPSSMSDPGDFTLSLTLWTRVRLP